MNFALFLVVLLVCFAITSAGTPAARPTLHPTIFPTSSSPTFAPTAKPTVHPTELPTKEPTLVPTARPTGQPTDAPTERPSASPTAMPSITPTEAPTEVPTRDPTFHPSAKPTAEPSAEPTERPTARPTGVNYVTLTKGGSYIGTVATDYFTISSPTDVILTGNGGSDRYIIKLVPGTHVIITDFNSDEDVIDLSELEGMYSEQFLDIIDEENALAISLPNGQLITLLDVTEDEFNKDCFAWASHAQAVPNRDACGLCFFIVVVVLLYGFYYQVYKAYTIHKQMEQIPHQEVATGK